MKALQWLANTLILIIVLLALQENANAIGLAAGCGGDTSEANCVSIPRDAFTSLQDLLRQCNSRDCIDGYLRTFSQRYRSSFDQANAAIAELRAAAATEASVTQRIDQCPEPSAGRQDILLDCARRAITEQGLTNDQRRRAAAALAQAQTLYRMALLTAASCNQAHLAGGCPDVYAHLNGESTPSIRAASQTQGNRRPIHRQDSGPRANQGTSGGFHPELSTRSAPPLNCPFVSPGCNGDNSDSGSPASGLNAAGLHRSFDVLQNLVVQQSTRYLMRVQALGYLSQSALIEPGSSAEFNQRADAFLNSCAGPSETVRSELRTLVNASKRGFARDATSAASLRAQRVQAALRAAERLQALQNASTRLRADFDEMPRSLESRWPGWLPGRTAAQIIDGATIGARMALQTHHACSTFRVGFAGTANAGSEALSQPETPADQWLLNQHLIANSSRASDRCQVKRQLLDSLMTDMTSLLSQYPELGEQTGGVPLYQSLMSAPQARRGRLYQDTLNRQNTGTNSTLARMRAAMHRFCENPGQAGRALFSDDTTMRNLLSCGGRANLPVPVPLDPNSPSERALDQECRILRQNALVACILRRHDQPLQDLREAAWGTFTGTIGAGMDLFAVYTMGASALEGALGDGLVQMLARSAANTGRSTLVGLGIGAGMAGYQTHLADVAAQDATARYYSGLGDLPRYMSAIEAQSHTHATALRDAIYGVILGHALSGGGPHPSLSAEDLEVLTSVEHDLEAAARTRLQQALSACGENPQCQQAAIDHALGLSNSETTVAAANVAEEASESLPPDSSGRPTRAGLPSNRPPPIINPAEPEAQSAAGSAASATSEETLGRAGPEDGTRQVRVAGARRPGAQNEQSAQEAAQSAQENQSAQAQGPAPLPREAGTRPVRAGAAQAEVAGGDGFGSASTARPSGAAPRPRDDRTARTGVGGPQSAPPYNPSRPVRLTADGIRAVLEFLTGNESAEELRVLHGGTAVDRGRVIPALRRVLLARLNRNGTRPRIISNFREGVDEFNAEARSFSQRWANRVLEIPDSEFEVIGSAENPVTTYRVDSGEMTVVERVPISPARSTNPRTVFFRPFDVGRTNGDQLSAARRVATASFVNDTLGVEVVPRTRVARVNGRLGVISENSPGQRLTSNDLNHPSMLDPASLSELQATEFLNGNADVHHGNVHVQARPGGRATLNSFDQDQSFQPGILPVVRGRAAGGILPNTYTRRFVNGLRNNFTEEVLRRLQQELSPQEFEAWTLRREVLLDDIAAHPELVHP